MNQNIKTKQRGFTIVELLVVIVVIGILAAITIVSYTGVSNRAKGAQAKSNAAAIVKVAEAIFADNNAYPTTLTGTSPNSAFSNMTSVAKLPSTVTIVNANTNITAALGQTNFYLMRLNTGNGGKVIFYDYDKGARCDEHSAGDEAASASEDSCYYYGSASATNNYGTTLVTAFGA